MTEQANVASPPIPPTSTAPETEPSHQEKGTEAADVSTEQHMAEPAKEGAEQATSTDGMIYESPSDEALRLTPHSSQLPPRTVRSPIPLTNLPISLPYRRLPLKIRK